MHVYKPGSIQQPVSPLLATVSILERPLVKQLCRLCWCPSLCTWGSSCTEHV